MLATDRVHSNGQACELLDEANAPELRTLNARMNAVLSNQFHCSRVSLASCNGVLHL